MALNRAIVAIFLGLATSGSAFADAPKPEPVPAPKPAGVQAYGKQNPACLEWTDGCVICVRQGEAIHCSTPGITCQPGALVCKRPTKQDGGGGR